MRIESYIISQRISRLVESKCLTHSSFGEAYGNDGARGRSTHSKSPAHRPQYTAGAHSPYGGQSQNREVHRNTRDYSTFPQTLEELQLEYTRDAMEITQIRDKEEDEENNRHREVSIICSYSFV